MPHVNPPYAEASINGVPRSCPICDSVIAETLYFNRMVPFAGYDFSAPILRCRACDTVYAGTALALRDLTSYYANLSKYDTLSSVNEISSLDRERAEMGAAFVAPIIKSLRNALDVGCSAGVFLNYLRNAGIKQVHGIDPAAEARDVARALFDINVTQAGAETYESYGEFDLICLMAVLEHLLEPRRLLEAVARKLKPGARVLVEVPDAGAFDYVGANEQFEPFGEFTNEHINFFSIGDIRRLAHAVGLEVERWMSYCYGNGARGFFALLHHSDATRSLVEPDGGSVPSGVCAGDSIERYVTRSLAAMTDVELRLAGVCNGGGALVYGAGNHTCRLMAQSTALTNCNVPAVFDRNRHLHGTRIGNSPVFSPENLGEFPGLPIIISTFHARHEIRTALQAGQSHVIVSLYD
jgi:SAM-dependent methyltransferase